MQKIDIDVIKKFLLEEQVFIDKMEEHRNNLLNGEFDKLPEDDMERMYWDMMSMPQYIQYGKRVIGVQERTRNFYRGEPRIYPSSKPSLYRQIPKSNKSAYFFIHIVQLLELSLFFRQLNTVNCWGRSSFVFEAVAQHYGFKTDVIDITNRLSVALFFACCTTDVDGNWRPLDNSDFIEPTDSTSPDSRYGVLYVQDSIKAGTSMIKPIGFQPFMRCHMQYGYYMTMGIDWDLRDKASGFMVFYFEHQADFCKEIFELMHGGELIYPNKSSDSIFLDTICEIKNSKQFSARAFDIACDKKNKLPFSYPVDFTKDQIIEDLKNLGYSIIPGKSIISDSDIISLNRQWCATCNTECDNRII